MKANITIRQYLNMGGNLKNLPSNTRYIPYQFIPNKIEFVELTERTNSSGEQLLDVYLESVNNPRSYHPDLIQIEVELQLHNQYINN